MNNEMHDVHLSSCPYTTACTSEEFSLPVSLNCLSKRSLMNVSRMINLS